MRGETWDQHSGSRANFHFGVSHLDTQRTFEDIPGFIVALVKM